MSECTHDCKTCSQDCSSRKEESLLLKPHELSDIKNVIAVVSGKGGVGKSMVTSMMSVLMNRKGYNTAILDADITGPSIPKSFGIQNQRATGSERAIFPVKTKTGIDVISLNLLIDNETDPVVYRGPIIAGTVKQFYTDVVWKDIDFMFVDMPPGTGDVPLTVFQSLPVKGIIIVTSPQELVSMIVEKAVKMAEMMNVPILGIVENMSYFKCDECSKEHKIFGESHIEDIVKRYNIENVSKLPINPKMAAACDKGVIELFEGEWLNNLSEFIEKKFKQ